MKTLFAITALAVPFFISDAAAAIASRRNNGKMSSMLEFCVMFRAERRKASFALSNSAAHSCKACSCSRAVSTRCKFSADDDRCSA